MAIVVTKKGKEIEQHTVNVVCDRCECEFICDNTDFENGVIKCPNCKKNIFYQDTLLRKYIVSDKQLDNIKMKIKDEIFDTIDFDKIHNHMVNVGWVWGLTGVPTIQKIKETLEDLIYDAIDNKATMSTGGFTVIYKEFPEDEENPHSIGVYVVFYVTSASSDVDVDTLDYVYY
jgi:hypothetical protein